MLSYLNFLIVYAVYFSIIRVKNALSWIPVSYLLASKPKLSDFDFSKIKPFVNILCLCSSEFNNKIKQKIQAELHTSNSVDDFEKINIELNENNYRQISSVFGISQREIFFNDYIIISLPNATPYELKYIHNLLFFFLTFDEYRTLQKRYEAIVVETSNCCIYAIKKV